ncbi:MAG: putative endonuclease [Acidimicrobiales bacterium]|jgi:putative endonuclease
MAKMAKTTKEIGDLGEKIALQYIIDQGYSLIEANYWRKWGEIDIIAKDSNECVHFIEVKTVSYETKGKLKAAITSGAWRPEEQVTDRKLHQINKAIETWLSEQNYKGEFVIDVIAVRMVPDEMYATVNFIENVIK